MPECSSIARESTLGHSASANPLFVRGRRIPVAIGSSLRLGARVDALRSSVGPYVAFQCRVTSRALLFSFTAHPQPPTHIGWGYYTSAVALRLRPFLPQLHRPPYKSLRPGRLGLFTGRPSVCAIACGVRFSKKPPFKFHNPNTTGVYTES